MGIVDDLQSMLSSARSDRSYIECDWRDMVRLVGPEMSEQFDNMTGSQAGLNSILPRQTATTERSKKIYDTTAVYMSDRLCAGMESLVSPQSDKWHGLKAGDPFAGEPTNEEEEWFDKACDYLFDIRYGGKSGFSLANQKAIRSAIKLGTGVIYIEQNEQWDDIRQPVFYRFIPMWQIFLVVDHRGEDVGFFREYPLTAEQAVRKFDGKVSEKVRMAAEDPKRKTDRITFIHACFEREGGYKDAQTINKSRWESVHYESETKHICKRGGYFEYPLCVFRWGRNDNSPYGTSAAAPILSSIKTLNLMVKDQIDASAQAISPPFAVHKFEQRLDLNARAVNPGLMDDQGRKLFSPMMDASDPSKSQIIIEALREQIREALFGTLWQVLAERNSNTTATEVMIRAKEKGEMIGPFASNIQAGYATLVERELNIIGRRGAFMQGSALELPETMADKDVGIVYTSPLDAFRRTGNLEKMQVVREYLMTAAQTTPEILDKIDPDTEADRVLESVDAPREMFRTDDEVAALRQQRAQQNQMQQQMMMAESMAKTAKDATPAVEAMNAVANG